MSNDYQVLIAFDTIIISIMVLLHLRGYSYSCPVHDHFLELCAEASGVDDLCAHPGSFGDMCFLCGQRLIEQSGVTFGYIHKVFPWMTS